MRVTRVKLFVILIALIFTSILIMGCKPNPAAITIANLYENFPEEGTSSLILEIEPSHNFDYSLNYNLSCYVISANFTIVNEDLPLYRLNPNRNKAFGYTLEIPNILISDLLNDTRQAYNDKYQKAKATYDDFIDRQNYELARRWASGESLIQESYDEMKRLEKQEQELRDAMNHIKIDYNAICKKYIKITLTPSETKVKP